MAFLSKVGNILRQGANKRIGSDLQAPSLSICQAVRWMSSMQNSKLFVGGISYSTDDQSLREAFTKYGEVVEARVIVDRETGRSRGFGFVTYTSSEEASSAIQALDGQDLHGRRVKVNYANDRSRGIGGGGFGSYGGGGYGGGGYGGGAGGYGGGAGGYGGGGYGGGGAGGYGGGGSGGYGDGGSGGYSGTGYSSGGNYSSNFGGDSQGSGGNYGNDFAGDSRGTVGTGGGFGGNDANNAASNFAGGNTYGSGTSAGFGTGGGNHNVSGGGSDYFANNSGSDASSGFGGYTGGDQFGSNETNSMNATGDQGLEEPLEGNDRDEDDDANDFAKRA